MKLYQLTITILAVLATSNGQKCKINKSAVQQGTVVSPALANSNGAVAGAPAVGSQAGAGTVVDSALVKPAAPQVSAKSNSPSSVGATMPAASSAVAVGAASSSMSQFPEPSQFPGQGTGVGRGPTGKCLYGRNYCGSSIRDLHTYDDLKAVYCSSPLCPYQNCGNGATCNPTETEVFESVYQCDDLVADFEGTSVFFLGSCATSGWVCVNPEPHCTTPRRARMAIRGLHY